MRTHHRLLSWSLIYPFFPSLYCRTFRTNTDTIYRFVFLCFQVPIVYIMHCHALWSCRELDVTFPEKTNSHICDLGDVIDIIFRVSFFHFFPQPKLCLVHLPPSVE